MVVVVVVVVQPRIVNAKHGVRHVETFAGFRTPHVQADQETKVHAYERVAVQLTAEQLQVRVRVAAFQRRRRAENHRR